MSQRDDDADDQSEQEAEDDENESESPEAPAPEPMARASKRSKSKDADSRSARPKTRPAEAEKGRRPAAGGPPTRAIAFALVALVALVAGGAGGWFGHEAQAKAKLRTESAPAAAGSSGPCNDWQQKICAASGDRSATCQQARSASELLTPTTCETALANLPATIAKVKAARASCEDLVSKLCGDLPKGSQACDLVKDKTPSIPAGQCKEMLEHYDEVIGQLRTMDQQGMGMGGPPGGPPGAMPPGHPAP